MPIVLVELQSFEDAHENISSLMLDIIARTSISFRYEVLQILGKNTGVLQLFFTDCV